MKAAVYQSYGPPEVVQIREIPTPEPGAREVRIRIHACTVNRTDCGFRSASYFISRFWSGLLKPKFHVLGCEFSGVIDQVGEQVTRYQVGDRVFGFNEARFGGHAEYTVMPEEGTLALLPESIDFITGAALTEGSHYALCDLRATRIKPGMKYLINGATGAIGSAAVQLATHLGAEVTAVCATPHLDLVASLGAHRVIDYTKEDFTQLDERFDVVFDAVGKSSFGRAKKVLKPQGIYVSTELGKGSENVWKAILGKWKWSPGKRVIFPLPTLSREDVEYLGSLAQSGAFKPVLDKTFSLDEIVEAYRYVETGMKVGNVVIRVVL